MPKAKATPGNFELVHAAVEAADQVLAAPVEPQPLPPVQRIETEEEVMQYTQDMRMRILDKVTAQGIPGEDPKLMGMMLMTLDGMDRAALGKMRIKSEESNGAGLAGAAATIAQLLTKAAGIKPFQSDVPVARELPQLPANIPAPTLVEGEIATAAPQQSYEAFQAKYGFNVELPSE